MADEEKNQKKAHQRVKENQRNLLKNPKKVQMV